MWKSQDTIENLSPIRRLGCLKANFYYEGIYAEYLWGFLSKTFGSYHLLENILALADWEATYITHDIESFCPKLFFYWERGWREELKLCVSLSERHGGRVQLWRGVHVGEAGADAAQRVEDADRRGPSTLLRLYLPGRLVLTHTSSSPPPSNNAHHNHINQGEEPFLFVAYYLIIHPHLFWCRPYILDFLRYSIFALKFSTNFWSDRLWRP